MKILWHSAAPWEPTGYGTQTAIWTTWLAKQGHTVHLSARSGLIYSRVDHGGLMVLPGPPFSGEGIVDELLPGHIDQLKNHPSFGLDLVIILYDMWSFGLPVDKMPRTIPVACWMPIDCTPVDKKDQEYISSGLIYPIAMSEFGKAEIQALGHSCGYVPHGIDTHAWGPLPGAKDMIRDQWDIPRDAFVIGINATSTDPTRKAIYEQMVAFKHFHDKHRNAVLMLHTLTNFPLGFNTDEAARKIGLDPAAVRVSPNYQYLSGAISADSMVQWYNCLDVLSNTSYGEGFGLAAIEAQACGTPVILARNSTGPQLVGPGWLVNCQPYWNARHVAQWGAPNIRAILKAYEAAYTAAGHKRQAAWEFAARFDVERVGPMWEPVLQAATGGQA